MSDLNPKLDRLIVEMLNINVVLHLNGLLLHYKLPQQVFFFSTSSSPLSPPILLSFSSCLSCIGCSILVLSNSFVRQSIPHTATCLTGDRAHQHLVYIKIENVYFLNTKGFGGLEAGEKEWLVSCW